jgi:hypothetical protein
MRPRTRPWIATWFVLAVGLYSLTLVVTGPFRLALVIAGALFIAIAIWPPKDPGSPWH